MAQLTGIGTKQRLITTLLFAALWIIADQLTKIVFKHVLTPGEVVSFFAGSVLVFPIYNHGAFLSVGAEMSDATRNIVFTYGVLAILIGMVAWVLRSSRLSRGEVIAIGCILGGGFSNVLDRFVYGGRVFDFLNVGIGQLRTGVFNVADMGIMLGVALLLLRAGKRGDASPGAAKTP
ncbi:signal peptidase II [Trinickia dabaoshanensis]|uniref:signal peptidase II n=1 Tax=Trinickia dabaoshanensis TaxID=564714 RepID=UPI001E54DFA3|nr:signal peptidase II [Trinickia dabaoshanensis]